MSAFDLAAVAGIACLFMFSLRTDQGAGGRGVSLIGRDGYKIT